LGHSISGREIAAVKMKSRRPRHGAHNGQRSQDLLCWLGRRRAPGWVVVIKEREELDFLEWSPDASEVVDEV
jgi:hypothetical protein